MSSSMQHQTGRNQGPRVQITYEVHTNGALEMIELPFLVGVMADLSGQPLKPLPPVKKRAFTDIDSGNFNQVLAGAAPRLAFPVDNKLTPGGGKFNVELKFQSLDDFSPAKVAGQIEPLKQLLDAREKLQQLLNRKEGNDKLGEMLQQIMTDTEMAQALAKTAGVQAPQQEGTANG